MMYDYDLFVIGAGSGGAAAAKQAAAHGVRVKRSRKSEVGSPLLVQAPTTSETKARLQSVVSSSSH